MTGPARERTYSWGDPGESATAARTSAADRLLGTAVSSILLIRP